MANPFVHVELHTGDPAKAKAFYSKLFGWKLKDMPMGPGMTYTMLDSGKPPGGGMQQKPMPDAPTLWLPYVEVADVKHLADITAALRATPAINAVERARN